MTQPIPVESVSDYIKDKGFDPPSVRFEVKVESAEERDARLSILVTENNARIEKDRVEHNTRVETNRFDNAYKRKKEASIYLLAGLLIVTLGMVSIIAFLVLDPPNKRRSGLDRL